MKYIIDLPDTCQWVQWINLSDKDGHAYFDFKSPEDLTPLDKELSSELGEAYHKGFEAGSHEATTLEYQQGLDDAWECARKISLMSPDEIEKVFPGAAKYNRYNLGYSGVEAIEKLKAYEEQQKADSEIKVGDEVCFVFAGGETIEPFIVFSIKDYNGKKYYEGMQTSDGRWVGGGLKYYKTGRNFPQVSELLKAMKEGAE